MKINKFFKILWNIKHFILIILAFVLAPVSKGQGKVIVTRAIIIDGDTIPIMDLSEISIISKRTFKNAQEEAKFKKLVRDVKKVYPYAQLAAIKLKEYNQMLAKASSEREKDRLMKQAERELKAQFEDDIQNMTFSQGKILIKLIDRQTGSTSYELVKELRGTLNAFFWQSFARIFGINLKAQYDPLGDDKLIEQIVLMIESGTI